jgi:hypothetical protein
MTHRNGPIRALMKAWKPVVSANFGPKLELRALSVE